MIINKNGNILDSKVDIICQQVNCQGVMGSGLAKILRTAYSEVYESYKDFCKTQAPVKLLGKVNWVTQFRGTDIIRIANIFGQCNYGRDGSLYTSYEALQQGLQEVHAVAKNKNYVVAVPFKIGCGLGGGDWNKVLEILQFIFSDEVVCEIWKYE